MTIILCGPKSVGKTTVGEALAEKLAWDFIDTDRRLLENQEQKIALRDWHANLGEKKFRALEQEVVTALQPKQPTVIATGGGVFLSSVNAAHLKKMGKVIYLENNFETLWARISAQEVLPSFVDSNHPKESFRHYVASRLPIYQHVADETLPIAGLLVDQIVDQIMGLKGGF